jgi:hypothetical protein
MSGPMPVGPASQPRPTGEKPASRNRAPGPARTAPLRTEGAPRCRRSGWPGSGWPRPLRSSRRWRLRLALACRMKSAEHLHRQAVGPAQECCALDPQRARASGLILGWQDPPQLRNQRRGYRVLQFAADRLKLPLQPGYALLRQAGSIYLLISPVQQRPDSQQPIWRVYPVGTVAVRTLADHNCKSPHGRGKIVLPLQSACGIAPVHRTRLWAGKGGQPGPFVPYRYRKVPSAPPLLPPRFHRQGRSAGCMALPCPGAGPRALPAGLAAALPGRQ